MIVKMPNLTVLQASGVIRGKKREERRRKGDRKGERKGKEIRKEEMKEKRKERGKRKREEECTGQVMSVIITMIYKKKEYQRNGEPS